MSFPKYHRVRLACLFLLSSVSVALAGPKAAPPIEAQLTVETDHPTARFDPRQALGAGLDGHWQGDERRMLSPANVQRMLAAGLGPIAVRLRTELAVEVWHWNPRGRWSDVAQQQGYWTSDAQPKAGEPILLTYGYKLPRRGNTLDEANEDGYSRLDDGDPATFWKSNPYLARPFTGEPDSRHPGWVVIDFGKRVSLNAVRIQWADPYAARFAVEYALKGSVYFGGHPAKVWTTFQHGGGLRGKGGEQVVKLADQPVQARYLRLWMTEGSGTAAPGATDSRDRLGYAIRELSAGWDDSAGAFHDEVRHRPDKRQSLIYVSSTDPWHRAADRDPKVEQPGFDLIFRSGITRGLPLMTAVPVLYDNIENAVALAAYAKASGYNIGRYELGEEPDGQKVAAGDFGALYAQAARGVRQAVPEATIGGPSFVTGDVNYMGKNYHEWLNEFRHELGRQGQARNFQFLSFEWYPFDEVLGSEADQLRQHGEWLEGPITRLRREHVPVILGEYNYSAYGTVHEVDLAGAMFNVETAAQFLSRGGTAAYYYGYEPAKLEVTQGSWGNQLMLLQNKGSESVVPVATYHALRMVTGDWFDPRGGVHEAFRVRVGLAKMDYDLISAFALKRPDQSWSLLVINKDPTRTARLSLKGFGDLAKARASGETATLVSYSAEQYRWLAAGPNGHPVRNDPPARREVRVDDGVVVPAWSVCVLQTK